MGRNWNSKGPEGKKLLELFTNNLVDLDNEKRDYIRSVKEKYPEEFGDFAIDRFAVNYRKLLRSFNAGQEKRGSRVQQRKCYVSRFIIIITVT